MLLSSKSGRFSDSLKARLAKIKSKPSGGSALEPTKKQSQNQNSPSLRRWGSSSSKPGRQNCLCSPTTHAGSFRCRHHRADSLTRVGSIGSNLAVLLSSKSGRFSDALKAQ
ncbi:hypothetical protein F2Q69_00043789 [Brassica cretica]|uniref:Serine-rich protein n=1 Tax=Brassica cretica TaxID=69181 RepID=A0A8S9NEJ3_BRACR|nr:hypothetical protein F2Q69_00043789 [Brassica cretica]